MHEVPPRRPDEPEEDYQTFLTYCSLPEGSDHEVLLDAHTARCRSVVREASVADAVFGELLDEALHGEGVTAVDLRARSEEDPHRELLPEECTLAVLHAAGIIMGPAWAVSWLLRGRGIYDYEEDEEDT